MFSDRNASRVALARLVSRMGSEAAFFVGIWGKAAYELNGTAGQIALVIAALGISGLAGSAIAGILVDRYDPRRVLIGAEILFVPATIALILANDLPTLIAVSGALGLVGAPTGTAIASFPPYLTRHPESLAKMNSLVETATMGGLILGPAAGGLLARWVGIDSIFVFDAITSIVAVAIVLRVRVLPDDRVVPTDVDSLRELRDGLRYAFGHQRLRFYLLAGGAVWVMFGLFSALEPLFYRDVLGQPPEMIGFVNTVFGLGLVVGTWLVGRLPAGTRSARTVLLLLAFNGVGAVVYVGTTSLAVVTSGGFVWAIAIGVFSPTVRTMLHVNTDHDLVGRVMGAAQMTGEAGKLLPLVFAPTLAAVAGVQQTLAAGGLVLGALALSAWPMARNLDRTRTTPVTVD